MQGRCRAPLDAHLLHLDTSRDISLCDPFEAHLLQPAARLCRVDAQAVGEQDERGDLGRLLALPRRAHALLELDERDHNEEFFLAFAAFEERAKEIERARVLYKYALETLPKSQAAPGEARTALRSGTIARLPSF